MSDFQYDSYDVSTLKVAFENLRTAEQQGFWLGVLGGFPFGVWMLSRKPIQNKIQGGPLAKAASALVFGSLFYGAYIFNARASYNEVAAKINRKYSLLLNKAMTYN